MNRHERRTRGQYIVQRLTQLRNSTLVNDFDLKDIPKDILDSLIANKCENTVLQKKYNTLKRIGEEAMKLEIELHNMKVDLDAKRQTKAPLQHQ
jgi:hypothetical protein